MTRRTVSELTTFRTEIHQEVIERSEKITGLFWIIPRDSTRARGGLSIVFFPSAQVDRFRGEDQMARSKGFLNE